MQPLVYDEWFFIAAGTSFCYRCLQPYEGLCMLEMKRKVVLLGGGVIGLSAAIVLAEAKYEVKVIEDPTLKRASDVAAAFWYPFHVDGYQHDWAIDTYDHFRSLLHADAGVFDVVGYEYFPQKTLLSKWLKTNWWTTIPSVAFDELPGHQLPHRFEAGVTFTVPVVRMPDYMEYLRQRFIRIGTLESRRVDRIADLLPECDVVVNCSGLGSRMLEDVGDVRLYPCRGQIVLIEPLPTVRNLIFITEGDEYRSKPLYIVPRGGRDIVLGGTTDEYDADYEPRPATTAEILERCSAFYPEIRSAKILDVNVGLRPTREGAVQVGLDSSGRFAKTVIHNYGHGGAGVTLSWGCGMAVRRLIQEAEFIKQLV